MSTAALRRDRLVDRENEAGGLGGGDERVLLDERRLPDKRLVRVANTVVVDVDAKPLAVVAAVVVLLAQLVEQVGRIEAGVGRQLARNDLERLGKRRNHQLLLAGNRERVLAQASAQLELNRAGARHNALRRHCSARNHQRVVQRTLRFVDKVLAAAAQNNRRGRRLGAAGEKVVALATNLTFFKVLLIVII